MKDTESNCNGSKSKTYAFFEMILLVVTLSVTALRLTITEGPWPQSSDELISQGPAVYSLLLSAVLITAFVIWVVCGFLSGRFVYRFNWIEVGVAVLIIASVVSGYSASNLRAAVTNTVILIAPLLMAVLLIQILDSRLKITLALAVIAAGGFLCAYQCSEQFFDTNKKLIEQYEQNPSKMLAQLRIEPGSLNHFQFEHRLYSKDIKGFFTTGNSAGSFLILALLSAFILLTGKIQNRKLPEADAWHIITAGLCTAAIAVGLLSTHSKGAIVSFVFSGVVFVVLMFCGSWINRHKKIILTICILLISAVAYGAIRYGLSHNSLPGGKSMLMRWQYWQAAAKMFADHPWTGVGAGNFGTNYLKYKLPETIETIGDPHNLVLSILNQFGPLGLAGLAVIILLPLSKISFGQTAITDKTQQGGKRLKTLLIVFIPIVLIIFRPIVTPLPPNATEKEIAAAAIILFLIPAVAFIIGFLLISAGPNYPTAGKRNIKTAVLFSAVLGVLIHNTIDFAIFEPPVLTVFCVVFACLIAEGFNQRQKPSVEIKPKALLKLIGLIAGLGIVAGFFYFCVIPVVKSISKLQLADKAFINRQFELADDLATDAVDDDRLSPFAPSIKGWMQTQSYLRLSMPQPELLIEAEKSYLEAIRRDKQNYKNYERLCGIYIFLSDVSAEPQRTEYLNKANGAESKAAELYPGLERLYFLLGQIAEQLGSKETALENYRKAIEIEQAFRENFKRLYPEHKVFSRLGEQQYNIAKQKITMLDKQENKN